VTRAVEIGRCANNRFARWGGDDLRREPVERRKAALAKLMRRAKAGLVLNEHIDEPGDVVFRHACKLGLEGHRIETARLALSPA
jgi:hypothetical protein